VLLLLPQTEQSLQLRATIRADHTDVLMHQLQMPSLTTQRHTQRYFRSRPLLISSLNFRISSNVRRGFSDPPAEVAVL
jgi:hypothetical protein